MHLRDALARAILAARREGRDEGSAEVAALRARAAAAEAEAAALRGEVLAALRLPRPPADDAEALAAVLDARGPAADGAALLAQLRVVHAVRGWGRPPVGEDAAAAAAGPAPPFPASPPAVAAFLARLLLSLDAGRYAESPRHCDAFAEASLGLLAPHPAALAALFDAVAAAAADDPGARRTEAAVAALARAVRSGRAAAGCAAVPRAALAAAAGRLRCAAERCAAWSVAEAGAPFGRAAEGDGAAARLAAAAAAAEGAHAPYRLALAALAALSRPGCAGAMEALEAFARVHSHAQACVPLLGPRFAMLAAAVAALTAAANRAALVRLARDGA